MSHQRARSFLRSSLAAAVMAGISIVPLAHRTPAQLTSTLG